MSNKQEKILYLCTCGKDRAEVAHAPFVLANAALAMDIQATIVLQGAHVAGCAPRDERNGIHLGKKSHSLRETEPILKKPVWLLEFRSLRGSGCRLGIGCTPFSNRFHRSPRVLPARACFLPTETEGTDQGVQRCASEPGLAEEQLLQMPRHRD